MGTIPSQPRRTRSRSPHQSPAQQSLRGIRPGKRHAALRSRHSNAPRPDAARRSPQPRTRLQPHDGAARHAGSALRRRNRHGRQSQTPRAKLRPHANAVVRRPPRRITKCDKPILPVISGGAYGFEHVNVAQQRRDPNSLMNWMERMIRMRKETPEIGWGKFTVLKTGTPEVLALRYDWRNNSVVVVHNLTAVPREISFAVGVENSDCLVNLLSGDNSTTEDSAKHRLLLEPYGYRWFRVGGLDYILKRTQI